MDGWIAYLALAVAALVALTAWLGRNRSATVQEEDDPDYHVLRSEYQSGVGGGETRTWKVPKDPQEYARYFVPTSAEDKEDPK